MIKRSTDGKVRVLSLSYGKDSMACLGAIDKIGLPLDRIVHAEIWATDTIQAELPPMVEFKEKADRIIKERYGIDVERYRANKTYEQIFYRVITRSKQPNRNGTICGFPIRKGNWCCSELKLAAIAKSKRGTQGCLSYVGIASDEIERLNRLKDGDRIYPLVMAGWTEKDCMDWCISNGLRSPIYDNFTRGGCWFCHNQTTLSLRDLRKNYPELWGLLLKWDSDSPKIFKQNGLTVHDYDKRFQLEDEGWIERGKPFRWSMLEKPNDKQLSIFD